MIEPIINLIQYGLMGLIGFLIVGWLGFRIPARVKKPHHQETGIPPALQSIPADLPAPIKRYLQILHPNGLSCPKTLAAWGNGHISSNLRGIGPVWLPLSWTLFLKPGQAFLWHVTVTWFTRPFLRGGDEFKLNHGKFKMGGNTLESEYIDQSEFSNLWIYTIFLAPSALVEMQGLKWDILDENTVWLTVPGSPETFNSFKLIFNPSTGLLEKVETKRAASRDGTKLAFQSNLERLNEFEPESYLPENLKSAWENEVFLRLSVAHIRYHKLVDQDLEAGL